MLFRALLLCFLLPFFCVRAQVPGASWERLSDAEAVAAGWSRAKLVDARAYSETVKTEAVVIVTRGKILESWGAVDRKFNIHSIRKSLLSALCGIQVEAGRLDLSATLGKLGIDDNEPVLSEEEKGATVHDLLKSRSGVYHPALYETKGMKARRPKRHSHPPGSFWYYNNWDFNVMGTIYERVAQRGIYEDFKERIAEPLMMEDYDVSDGSYVTGEDSIHRAYPFRMTARDLARFGLLYLREGKWGERQVVPADWVKKSVVSYSDAGGSGGYGYYWWIAKGGLHLPGLTLPDGSYSARGAGGHYILVIPKLDLLIVHRVNTDIDGRSVSSAEFGELVRRILISHEPSQVQASVPEACDTLLPQLMNRYRVPGVAVVGIERGQVAWEKYVGVREVGGDALVTDQTIFEAASMTKPIAAYAALKLVEDGVLDLDRPLSTYLPEPYLPAEPLHQKITARMVLNHTSGFPNWRRSEALKVMHEPGSKFLYSGEASFFLQRVLEHLTGQDYGTFIQRTLFQPLQMVNSSHVWRETFTAVAAAGHDRIGKVKPNRKLYSKANAAFSLYTTPRDYAAFVLEMMKSDRSADHSISAGSIRAMLMPSSPAIGRALLTRRGSKETGDLRFGLGWQIEPTATGSRIRHSGSNGTGFRCYTEFDPAAGHGVIIMTNSDAGDDLWKDLVSQIARRNAAKRLPNRRGQRNEKGTSRFVSLGFTSLSS